MENDTTMQDTSAEVAENTETQDAFLQAFEDSDSSDTSSEADAKDVEDAQEEPSDDSGSDVKKEEPTTEKRSITVNGQKIELSDSELIAAAQKGMDYDRVKGELHRYRDELPKYGDLVSMAKDSGMSVQELIDNTITGMQAAREEQIAQGYIDKGYDDDAAHELAKKDIALQAKQAADADKQPETQENQALQQQDVDRFLSLRPNVDPKSIPDSVWEDVRGGLSLTEAYLNYEVTKKEEELNIAKKNEENRSKAPGSARTKKAQETDAFLSEFMKD